MAKGGRGWTITISISSNSAVNGPCERKCRLRRRCNDKFRSNPEGGKSTLGEPDALKGASPVRRREWGNVLKSNAPCSYPTRDRHSHPRVEHPPETAKCSGPITILDPVGSSQYPAWSSTYSDWPLIISGLVIGLLIPTAMEPPAWSSRSLEGMLKCEQRNAAPSSLHD
jgi:hypothetical protein